MLLNEMCELVQKMSLDVIFVSRIRTILMILIISLLNMEVLSQCGQSCLICSSPQVCTSCVSKNNLLLLNSNIGCLPCNNKCQKCISQLQCSTCALSYYSNPITNQCQPCLSANCIRCNIYFPSICQQCSSSYYLQDSSSTCKLCKQSYLYSSTCIQNFILTCEISYFTTNGQLCTKCIDGCKKCTSIVSCAQCLQGYYLLNNKCNKCISTCKTCSNNSTCTTCNKGYRINSNNNCQLCTITNCTACTMLDICIQCSNDTYLDNQNKICKPLLSLTINKKITNCIKYSTNYNYTVSLKYPTTDILCTSCITSTYLNAQLNSCQTCSILCQTCSNHYRSSKCYSCVQNHAELIDTLNGICAPKLYTLINAEKILYFNSRNQVQKYNKEGQLKSVNQGVKGCPGGVMAEKVNINIGSNIGYKYNIIVKLMLSKKISTNTIYTLNILFNQKPIHNQSISSQSTQSCSQIYLYTFQFSFSLLNNLSISLDTSKQINYSSLNNSINYSSLNNSINYQSLNNSINYQSLNNSINYQSLNNSILPQNNTFQFKSTLPDTLIDIRQIIIKYKECQSTCKICVSYQICVKCDNDNKYIEGGKCVDICNNGYYKDNIRNICILQCYSGMYPNTLSNQWQCLSCPSSCTTCTSLQTCQTCSSGYYLYNRTCILTCPDKYYPNNIIRRCQKCIYPCSSCLSSYQCSSCQIGFYYKQNNTCVIQCPQTLYGNMITMSCEKCIMPCLGCKSLNKCVSCVVNITLNANYTYFTGNNTCILTQNACPKQYYLSIDTNKQIYSCILCDFPCKQCINQSTLCTKCTDGYLLSNNYICISICPSQYFSSKTFRQCIPCQSPCKTCINSQRTCLSCELGYKLNLQLKKCSQNSCENGFYYDNTTLLCKYCKSQCKSCQSYTKCIQCNQQYYLYNNTCLSTCPDKYYKAQQISILSNQNINTSNQSIIINKCLLCSSLCKKCYGNSNYCIQCNQNYYLQQNNTCLSICLQTQLFPSCLACEYPCYSCQSKINQCTSCVTDYYLAKQSSPPGCVTECYYSYYKAIQKGFGICKKCIQPCVNCLNENYCYTCQIFNRTMYYLQTIHQNNTKICVTKCGLYEYGDSQKLLCISCISPCRTCTSRTYCLTCQNGILRSGMCFSSFDGCPVGEYKSTKLSIINNITTNIQICQKCISICSSCTSISICTGCLDKYYLNNNTCVKQCPLSTTSIDSLRKCLPCEYPCEECSLLSTNCTKCQQIYMINTTTQIINQNIVCPQTQKSGNYCIIFHFYKGQCLTECATGTYANGLNCEPCNKLCQTCTSNSSCSSCIKGAYLLQNNCFTTCPQQYYPFSQNNQCLKCQYPCKTCQNQTKCKTCRQGYLFNNQCLIKQGCPVYYYQTFNQTLLNYCQKCNPNCIMCTDTKQNCIQCKNNSYFHGSCNQKCIDGYYIKQKLSQYLQNTKIKYCQRCPLQCLTCTQNGICLTCSFSYTFYSNTCIKRCPKNYMQKIKQIQYLNNSKYQVSVCKQCISPCSQCIVDQNSCQKCIQLYYLYDKKCVQSCPQGTYLNILTNSCKKCPFPCKLCRQQINNSKIICSQCHSGYYLQQQKNICVDSCIQSFIDYTFKKCISNCSQGYQTIKINSEIKFCTYKCQLPYITNSLNKSCVIQCQQNQIVNSQYSCQFIKQQKKQEYKELIPEIKYNLFRSKKGVPSVYIQFNKDVLYMNGIKLYSSLQVKYKMFDLNNNHKRKLQSMNNNNNNIINYINNNDSQLQLRILGQQMQMQQQIVPFQIIHYNQQIIIIQLYPSIDLYPQSYITFSFLSNSNFHIISSISKIPLQQSQYQIKLQQNHFQTYSYYQLANRYKYIPQIIIDFILILSIIMLIFNRYAKIYHFLIFSQSIFMLLCLNIKVPPNLYSFLQGFKFAHFYQFDNLFVKNNPYKKYSDLNGENFNRIQSVFGDINFIKITGHLICVYIAIIIIVIILYVLRYLPKISNQYVQLVLSKLQQKLKLFKWSHITDIFISTFMLILSSFCFQTNDYSVKTVEQSIGILFSYFFMLIFMSYLVYYIYKNNKMRLLVRKQPKKFIKKSYIYRQQYISFFEGINRIQNIYKNYLLIIKILIYGIFTGTLYNYPNFCLSIFLLLQISYSFIYLLKKPYSDQYQNYFYFISGILHSLSLILIAVISQLQLQIQDTFNISLQIIKKSENIKNNKWILGYFVIAFILIAMFLLIIQMVLSIMRGNINRKKLDGEEEDYIKVQNNQTKNSPKSPIYQHGPKKIIYQQKKVFQAYSINNFLVQNVKSDKDQVQSKQQ